MIPKIIVYISFDGRQRCRCFTTRSWNVWFSFSTKDLGFMPIIHLAMFIHIHFFQCQSSPVGYRMRQRWLFLYRHKKHPCSAPTADAVGKEVACTDVLPAAKSSSACYQKFLCCLPDFLLPVGGRRYCINKAAQKHLPVGKDVLDGFFSDGLSPYFTFSLSNPSP